MGLGFPCSYPQKVSRFKALFTSSIHTHIWLLFYLSPSYGQDILWMFSSQVVPSTRNRASLTLRNATWPWLNDKWMTPESKALTFCCTTESSVAETSPAAMSSPWSFFFPFLLPPWTHSFSWHIIPSIKYRPAESKFCPSEKKIAPLPIPAKVHWCAQASFLIPSLVICAASTHLTRPWPSPVWILQAWNPKVSSGGFASL